jgi:hypothetical protein
MPQLIEAENAFLILKNPKNELEHQTASIYGRIR